MAPSPTPPQFLNGNADVSEVRTVITNPRIASVLFNGRSASDALKDPSVAMTTFIPVNGGARPRSGCKALRVMSLTAPGSLGRGYPLSNANSTIPRDLSELQRSLFFP